MQSASCIKCLTSRCYFQSLQSGKVRRDVQIAIVEKFLYLILDIFFFELVIHPNCMKALDKRIE